MREGRHYKEGRKDALRRTQEFARLFLAPGVAHCGGGAGADTFDPVITVEQWVETGAAPDQIIASKVVNGATTFTRPLCPYPALPRYSGVGDTTKASSFVCVEDSDRDDSQTSAPKYLNGHSDVVAGTLTGARDDAFWQRLVAGRSGGGAILGNMETYLLTRGMRTLFLRALFLRTWPCTALMLRCTPAAALVAP